MKERTIFNTTADLKDNNNVMENNDNDILTIIKIRINVSFNTTKYSKNYQNDNGCITDINNQDYTKEFNSIYGNNNGELDKVDLQSDRSHNLNYVKFIEGILFGIIGTIWYWLERDEMDPITRNNKDVVIINTYNKNNEININFE